MRIRIGESLYYIDVPHTYLSGGEDKEIQKKLEEVIKDRDLKCDGCGKPLKNKEWISVIYRPKSALNKEARKFMWAVFLFCYDTREDCINKWEDRRPK